MSIKCFNVLKITTELTVEETLTALQHYPALLMAKSVRVHGYYDVIMTLLIFQRYG